jgi:hypothetical protein
VVAAAGPLERAFTSSGYTVDYPRHIDGSHHHVGDAATKRATVQIRSVSDTFEQALLEAGGSLDPDATGAVGYARVFPGVSVVYQPLPNALKDGQTAFTLTSPFMHDSAGNGSKAVAVSLRPAAHHGARGYEVTITADDAWLDDPARAYPVGLDPTVITEPICVDLTFSVYETLSFPVLTDETLECLLDPEQPGLSCDVEGFVPVVNEGHHEVGRCATGGASAK